MPITYGTPVTDFNNTNFATAETKNLSTDAGAGDYRVLVVVGLPNGTTPAAGSFSVDLPTGWTQIAADNSNATSDQYILVCYRKWQSGDPDTVDLTFTGGSLCSVSQCVTVHGADQAQFLDVAVPAVIRPLATAQFQSPAITTVTDGSHVVHVVVGDGSVGSGMVNGDVPSGDTLIDNIQANTTPSNGWGFGFAYRELLTAGSVGIVDWGTLTEEFVGITFAIRAGVAVTIEQEGFRFRNDNGSEASATWMAAQDTNISLAALVPFRLRFLLDTTGDAPSQQVTLQYKRSDEADTEWRNV